MHPGKHTHAHTQAQKTKYKNCIERGGAGQRGAQGGETLAILLQSPLFITIDRSFSLFHRCRRRRRRRRHRSLFWGLFVLFSLSRSVHLSPKLWTDAAGIFGAGT